jgi:hypothetical protein
VEDDGRRLAHDHPRRAPPPPASRGGAGRAYRTRGSPGRIRGEESTTMLDEIDPNRITPVEALMKLSEMKDKLQD